MATPQTKATIRTHFETLFAADIAAGAMTLTVLTNLQDPEPPRTLSALDQAHLFIGFPPTNEAARGLGGPGLPWDEAGAFMLHVLVGRGEGEAKADDVMSRAKQSLRGQTIGDTDILDMFGAEAGPKYGGNWWGQSLAVAFETQDI